MLLPLATVSNDADKKKVAADKKVAEKKAPETTEVQDGAAEPASEPSGEEGEEPQQAAFNPETGEINWDCPCLGGMAHGPCGEEFKAAFSCFVYSESEPKGIDCIEKFEAMRTCFKQHPEHYKEELYEDDEPVPSTGEAAAVELEAVPVEATPVEVVEVTPVEVVEVDVIAEPEVTLQVTETPAEQTEST